MRDVYATSLKCCSACMTVCSLMPAARYIQTWETASSHGRAMAGRCSRRHAALTRTSLDNVHDTMYQTLVSFVHATAGRGGLRNGNGSTLTSPAAWAAPYIEVHHVSASCVI